MELSAESVLALAPDAASAKAANGLLKPGGWPTLGADAAAVWGECQRSHHASGCVRLDAATPAAATRRQLTAGCSRLAASAIKGNSIASVMENAAS